jgi:rhodanese-related sulfurtransferase
MLDDLFDSPYREVDVDQARAAVERGAVLLDVREPQEWQAGHAPQAVHIPLGELAGRADELPTDAAIMVICRSGNRSAHATRMLAARGEAANVAGGMAAWERSGLPVVDDHGAPGSVI